jgi:hypothetical protein
VPDSGEALGADLYKLLVVGKDDLPSVAAIYGEAVQMFGNTAKVAADAMRRPEYFGGSLGRVHDSWMALRDTVNRFLSDTQGSLDDTGHALVLAVGAYEASDTVARDKLRSLRQQNGEPHPGQVTR